MNMLGFDIGGAHLKLASTQGPRVCRPFALWKSPDQLVPTLSHLLTQNLSLSSAHAWAVTMTAELCDCFVDKAQGVAHVLDALEKVRSSLGFTDVQVWIYSVQGQWLTPEQARQHPWRASASNWRALGDWLAKKVDPQPTIMIDMGSTTTDVLAMEQRQLRPMSLTDFDRLHSRELVYVGSARTPIHAVMNLVTLDGRDYPLMAEVFSSVGDAWVTLGLRPETEDADDSTWTADGRPLTKENCRNRLARMVGSDRTRFSFDHAFQFAQQVRSAVADQLQQALNQVVSRQGWRLDACTLLGLGSGADLLPALLSQGIASSQWSADPLPTGSFPLDHETACAIAAAQMLQDWFLESGSASAS